MNIQMHKIARVALLIALGLVFVHCSSDEQGGGGNNTNSLSGAVITAQIGAKSGADYITYVREVTKINISSNTTFIANYERGLPTSGVTPANIKAALNTAALACVLAFPTREIYPPPSVISPTAALAQFTADKTFFTVFHMLQAAYRGRRPREGEVAEATAVFDSLKTAVQNDAGITNKTEGLLKIFCSLILATGIAGLTGGA